MIHFPDLGRSLAQKLWATALILLLGVSGIHAQDTTTDLMIHYSFDGTGTTVSDETGNGYNGTLNGDATLVTGFDGTGIQMVNKTDYVRMPEGITTDLTSFTFAAWVKINDLKEGVRLFDWGSGADGAANTWSLETSTGEDDGYLAMRYIPVTGNEYTITSSEKLPVGEWAHVAFTCSWSSVFSIVYIYINGEQVAYRFGLPLNPSKSLGTTTDNYLGYSRWTTDTNGFDGIMDDVRVYSRALSADDVAALGLSDKLDTEYENLTIENADAITDDITLITEGATYSDVTIEWESSNPYIISETGTVDRPNYFDYGMTLTATVKYLNYTPRQKTFEVNVVANEGTKFSSDLVMKYDFSNLDGSTVKDVAEHEFTGTLMNDAAVVTIGNDSTGVYNVLNLGNGTGYFDMGEDVGEVLAQLSDFTISVFYRMQSNYVYLSRPGNFLWNFSHTTNVLASRDGYFIGSTIYQGISMTPGFYTSASGNEELYFDRNVFKGSWHNLTYKQEGTRGTVYIDGIPMVTGTITNLPVETLRKEDLTGTICNWIGRSCYTSDVYLRRTMIYDMRLYKTALSDDEIMTTELKIPETIALLDNAYGAYVAETKTAESTVLSEEERAVPLSMTFEYNDASTDNVNMKNIEYLKFSDTETTVMLENEGPRVYTNDDIQKITFSGVYTSTNDVLGSSAGTMEVYPNPADGYIYVDGLQGSAQTASIYSMTGQMVWSDVMTSVNQKIDISSLEKGVYIIKSGSNVAKFVKQ